MAVGIIFTICVMPVSAEGTNVFSDVNETDWFYESVVAGVERGYIDGFEDGSFKPNNIVTYGEFYKMLAEAFDMDIEEMKNPAHWAMPYSRTLYRNGDKAIQTNPIWFDSGIPRKEVVRNVVFVAGDIRNVVSAEYYDEEVFEDMPNPTIYNYDGYILIAKKAGVVFGDNNGRINPDSKITRAEAVAIIERALAVESWEIGEPDILKGLNISYSAKYAETFKDAFCMAINKFPREIIENFIKDNGEILITDEDPEEYYDFKSQVVGLYMQNENKIVLFADGQAYSLFSDMTGTLIHEMAHYIYDEMVTSAEKRELKKIFDAGVEPEMLTYMTYDDYGETDVDEYFAELVCYSLSSKMTYRDGEIPQSLAIVNKYVPNN